MDDPHDLRHRPDALATRGGKSIQEAVQCLKLGDISGLETLVMCYQAKAVRIAFLIMQDEPAAEDIVQDTFIRIYRNIRSFDQTRPFEPYLMQSVVYAALNNARQMARTVSLDDDPTLVEALLARAASPEAQVEGGQLAQEILAALSKLTPRQRAAIVQRYYLEMSEKEMAEALRSAPGTVKWLLNSARSRLRSLLRPERSIK